MVIEVISMAAYQYCGRWNLKTLSTQLLFYHANIARKYLHGSWQRDFFHYSCDMYKVVEQISITNNKFLYWIAMNNLISKKTSSKTSHALAHISYLNCNLGEETSEKNHQTIKTIAIHKRITFVKVRKTLFNDNGTLKKGF